MTFLLKILYITLSLLTFVAMLKDPAAALLSVQAAADSWWSKVLPALLPFFIISEILCRSGFINLLGVWLTPLMQPLFKLPGAAAIGLLLGFFSGAPTGGAITANLREARLISQNQGNRMLAFCNNTGPIYLLITVSALLGEPSAGLYLAAVQYPINLIFGLVLGIAAAKCDKTAKSAAISPIALWLGGIKALRTAPHTPLGLLLKESSLKAITTIGMIGAFMIIFSLLINALRLFGINRLLFVPLLPLLSLLGIDKEAALALGDGFFEMTLGLNTLAACDIDFFDKLLAAAAILGWSGISVQIQVAGVISNSDLKLCYYLPCRLIHAIAAPLLLLCFSDRIISNSSTFATTNLPHWLTIPGATLAPAVLLLLLLVLAAYLLCLALWLLHRRKSR